ncbi:MAG: hypothetical protein H6900_02380 [Rhodobacter sp.]|uniref:hypothetical protein n=1 Tax=Pararhodobacter sp. TaxID=2127056 RepID=UPI001DB72042|nr:hypothetical protein [Pararhodobacter sp.]MCB1344826.1 hypothetical protein [Paracoccaceae bacterium]MCC0072115.1 hypothetical protein [Rhodobacter sp.]HPD91614.1 hypothetical protein [Pararhodobacter sp.]
MRRIDRTALGGAILGHPAHQCSAFFQGRAQRLRDSTFDLCDGALLPAVARLIGVEAPAPDAPLPSLAPPLPADWPVRDQGRIRGTCVAFSALAAVELGEVWQGIAPGARDYSEEHLYALMRGAYAPEDPDSIPGYADGATILLQAAASLNAAPIRNEADLPYVYDTADPAHVQPLRPDPAQDAAGHQPRPPRFVARLFATAQDKPLDGFTPALHLLLRHRVPPCIALPLFDENGYSVWTDGVGWDKGMVMEPEPWGRKTKIAGGHSICLVGYVADRTAPGGGWFRFRNSWGRRFAATAGLGGTGQAAAEAGYGYLSRRHVEDHCWELMFRSRPADCP